MLLCTFGAKRRTYPRGAISKAQGSRCIILTGQSIAVLSNLPLIKTVFCSGISKG